MEIRTVTVGNDKEQLLSDFTAHGIIVPAGFIFDGASAPRYLWFIIPPFKGTKKAACIHDWLCKEAKNADERATADRIFYELLKESFVPRDKPTSFWETIKFILKRASGRTRSYLGYLGVRFGALIGVGVYYGE